MKKHKRYTVTLFLVPIYLQQSRYDAEEVINAFIFRWLYKI
jgi:hypothetical protein